MNFSSSKETFIEIGRFEFLFTIMAREIDPEMAMLLIGIMLIGVIIVICYDKCKSSKIENESTEENIEQIQHQKY